MRASLVAALALLAGLFFFYSPVLFGKVLVDRDLFRLFIPDASFLRESLARGEWPLWNPYQRLGQPFAATLYSQVYYPPHLLLVSLLAPARALTWQIIGHVGLLAAGLYLLARRLGLPVLAACAAGAVAAFTPLVTQLASQVNILSAAAWTGLLVVAVLNVLDVPSRGRIAAVALVLSLSLLAGSPEVILWQTLLCALVSIGARARHWAAWALGFAWAAAIAAVVLLPGAEFAANSGRLAGQGDQLDWSCAPADLVGMAWLGFERSAAAGLTPRSDFLPTPFMGFTSVLLALAGAAAARRRPEARPFVAGALVLGALSLGQHFFVARLLLLIPPLHLFRYPSRYLLGAALCLAVLTGYGVQALGEALSAQRRQRLTLAGALGVAAAALAGLSAVTGGLGFGWAAACCAAMACLFAVTNSPSPAHLACLAVCAAELYAAHRYFRAPGWLPFSQVDHPSALAALIPRDGSRISVQLEDGEARYQPPDLIAKSRDALYPLRWVEERLEAADGYGAPEPLAAAFFDRRGAGRSFYELAGARYFVQPAASAMAPERLGGGEGLPGVFKSPSALPRAFVVHQVVTQSREASLELLTGDKANLSVRVGLERDTPLPQPADCPSSARREAIDPRTTRVSVEACADGVLVVTDAYYPGWAATLDGQPIELLRANGLVRAVAVPKGAHTVVMRYAPWTAKAGAAVSAAAVLALAAAFVRRGKRGPK
jgi:hypothetical protein